MFSSTKQPHACINDDDDDGIHGGWMNDVIRARDTVMSWSALHSGRERDTFWKNYTLLNNEYISSEGKVSK